MPNVAMTYFFGVKHPSVPLLIALSLTPLKGKGVPANESIAFLVLMIYLGRLRAKKTRQRSGKKIGSQGCNERKVHLIVRATDLPGSIHFCLYVL